MKRTLFLATAAIAIFGSCTKQKVDEATQGSNLISFESHLGNTTKGTPKADFAMGDQFFVYGGETGSNDYTLNPSNTGKWVFTTADLGVTVTNYGTNWRYSPAVSWSSSKISFFAFSPVPLPVVAPATSSAETYGITQHAPATVAEIPKITFQVKGGYTSQNTATEIAAARAEIKKQVDLLWANSFNNSKSNPTVALPFKHALSQLNFSVRANHAQGVIRINGITVKKVKTKADLVLAHDETKKAEENYLGGWTSHSVDAPNVKDFDLNLRNDIASSIAVGKGVQSVLDNDEVLMMIPQATTDIELVVKYAHSIDGVIWENYETGSEVTVKVNSVTSHWKPNTRYNYILNITPGVTIGFTATIEDWDADVKDEEYNEVSAISADVKGVWKYTAAEDCKISADYSTTTGQTDWITFSKDGNVNSADLTSTAASITAATELIFNVKANNTTADRIAIITIDKGAKGTVKVKVTQAAGDGKITHSMTVFAGEVLKETEATGVAVKVKLVSGGGAWLTLDGTELTTTEVDIADATEFVVAVTDNDNVTPRDATFEIDTDGAKAIHVVKQAGLVAKTADLTSTAVGAALKEIVLAKATDYIVLTSDADWLTDGASPANALVKDTKVTTAGTYNITSVNNLTTAARTATVNVRIDNVLTTYTIAQAAAAEIILSAIDVAGGPSVDVEFFVGDVIVANAAASWLTLEGAQTATDFNADVTIATAGMCQFRGGVNTGGPARAADLTILRADGSISILKISQAGV